jgi:hypothetical protein
MSIISAVKTVGAKVVVKAAKYAPHILVTVGIGSVTAGTVMAVKNATKADEVIENFNEKMAQVEEAKQLAEEKKVIYTHKNEMEDKFKIYTYTAYSLVKKNWLPIVLYVGGVAMIMSGFHIISQRYIGMAASYAALHKSYTDYRKRVVEKEGTDADFRYANGIKDEVLEYSAVDGDGEAQDVHEDVKNVIDDATMSVYAVLFDEENSSMWTPNAVTNKAQIKAVEEYWNRPSQFERRGFVYYFEVLRDLGIWDRLPIDTQKALVGLGWVWGHGDNRVSLGIFDINKPKSFAQRDFITGYEPSLLIEPNLDGMVAELL